MNNKTIAIIGVGAIGKAFAKGLLQSGVKSTSIILSNKASSNRQAVSCADWIIIAVKPPVVKHVLEEVKDLLKNKLILSLAAGVSISSIEKRTHNPSQAVIRLMPNIPVSIIKGVIGLYANNQVGQKQKKEVIALLSTIGFVFETKDEKLLDTITLIAGCGPALMIHFIELLVSYASRHRLSSGDARTLAIKTFTGTAAYLEQSHFKTTTLGKSTSTKGGITEAILSSFKEDGLNRSFKKSLQRGRAKMKALGKSLL